MTLSTAVMEEAIRYALTCAAWHAALGALSALALLALYYSTLSLTASSLRAGAVMLSLQPRLGNFPPGYDPKTGRWEACPYCGSQDVTHPRVRGEGDWQGHKPCNAGLKRDGTIYPLKDGVRVGPKAGPQTH